VSMNLWKMNEKKEFEQGNSMTDKRKCRGKS